jgi:uncharacterized protein (DUF58 family)
VRESGRRLSLDSSWSFSKVPLRRRAWLSREGVYYAGVLLFIGGAAVLQSYNLLVALAGMMTAPLLLNWRLVMGSLRGLFVERRLPEQVPAGETLTVEIRLENVRWWMASHLVLVEDWIVWNESVSREKTGHSGRDRPMFKVTWRSLWQLVRRLLFPERTHAEALAAQVPPRGGVTATYRVKLPRRGKYRFGPLRVSTRYPLGLVWGHFVLEQFGEILVTPHVGRLLPAWAELLDAEQAGDQRRHPQRGLAEGDYYGLRPWQSGDSTRWIHWRSTAKTGIPTVIQYERQRNRDVAIVLDPWLPAEASDEARGRLELAISLAATALEDLAFRGHTQLALAVAGAEIECWAGSASPTFCHDVLAELALVPGTEAGNLEAAIRQARGEAPAGARLIVISSRQPQVPADPERDNLWWIDVGAAEIGELFQLV